MRTSIWNIKGLDLDLCEHECEGVLGIPALPLQALLMLSEVLQWSRSTLLR